MRDFISFYLIMKYYKHIFISQYFKFHRKEKELDSKVRKPAEAEKYRLEKIAEAEKMKIVLEAEALAEAKQVKVVYTLLYLLHNIFTRLYILHCMYNDFK